jgi:hypothetical protein
MAKRVFFSFHYQDVVDFRANVVRNHWLLKPDRDAAGFFDHSLWESTKRTGKQALKNLIHSQLTGASVTCVLIGSHTYDRPWVRYEILKSYRLGKKVFGVHINGIAGKDGQTKNLGPDPFEHVGVSFSDDGGTGTLWEKVGNQWVKYTEVDGSATFDTNVTQPYRGQGFNFARWYRTYKWNADDGYDNFATWVG